MSGWAQRDAEAQEDNEDTIKWLEERIEELEERITTLEFDLEVEKGWVKKYREEFISRQASKPKRQAYDAGKN
jgi:hypothetical protein